MPSLSVPVLRARSWYFSTGSFRCLARDILNEARIFYAAGMRRRLIGAVDKRKADAKMAERQNRKTGT